MNFKVNYAVCMALVYFSKYKELLNVSNAAVRNHTYYNRSHNSELERIQITFVFVCSNSVYRTISLSRFFKYVSTIYLCINDQHV